MKPEILEIFKSSLAVSIVSGKSNFLTRDSKTTKDQIEIKILNEEKKEMERRSEEFKGEIEHLKDKLSHLEDVERENEENLENLEKLYDAGIINEDGNLVTNDMN